LPHSKLRSIKDLHVGHSGPTDDLQQQEAIIADPAQKFALKKQIEEAEQKICELGG
jgi:hypothetical protein